MKVWKGLEKAKEMENHMRFNINSSAGCQGREFFAEKQKNPVNL